MYDRIVIAVDGSDEASGAARRGLQFARTFGAAVHVLTVVERRALGLAETPAEEARVRERGREVVAAVEALAADLGRPVTTEVADGRPAVEIGRVADERDADLIVVGRQGATGLGRRLVGGVTERLLHRSSVPVLVVPLGDRDGGTGAGAPAGFSRVLLTTDGSDLAAAAIPHGVAVARGHGAALHVLYVVDVQAEGGLFSAGGLEAEFLARLDERGRRAVAGVATDVEATAPEVAVETAVERTTSFGGAAAGIRAYVEDRDVDIVVASSHGRSGLGRGLLGSVTSTVLRTVDVPTLVVNGSG
jgi:nucleotide-binding universal stress UspA family protein